MTIRAIRTDFKEMVITVTPTNVGLNVQLEVRREGRDIRMVMPGLPEDRAQKILDAISGSAAKVVGDA